MKITTPDLKKLTEILLLDHAVLFVFWGPSEGERIFVEGAAFGQSLVEGWAVFLQADEDPRSPYYLCENGKGDYEWRSKHTQSWREFTSKLPDDVFCFDQADRLIACQVAASIAIGAITAVRVDPAEVKRPPGPKLSG